MSKNTFPHNFYESKQRPLLILRSEDDVRRQAAIYVCDLNLYALQKLCLAVPGVKPEQMDHYAVMLAGITEKDERFGGADSFGMFLFQMRFPSMRPFMQGVSNDSIVKFIDRAVACKSLWAFTQVVRPLIFYDKGRGVTAEHIAGAIGLALQEQTQKERQEALLDIGRLMHGPQEVPVRPDLMDAFYKEAEAQGVRFALKLSVNITTDVIMPPVREGVVGPAAQANATALRP